MYSEQQHNSQLPEAETTDLGPAVVHVPEANMPVADGQKAVSVFREGHRVDLGGDLRAGDLQVVPPVPHIDHHVVLTPNRNQVTARRRKADTADPEVVTVELFDLHPLFRIPHSDHGLVTALQSKTKQS